MLKCGKCEIYREQLGAERKRVDELLDRLMKVQGREEATTPYVRPNLEQSSVPDVTEEVPEEELTQERLDVMALAELEEYAKATGTPIEKLYDFP